MLKLCKENSCRQPVTAIAIDKKAPLITTINPKDGLTSTIHQPSLYGPWCYYHNKVKLGLIRE